MAKLTIAPAAEADLDDIWNYISEKNEQAADKFILDLAAKFQLLIDNKNLGKQQDDLMVGMRMFPVKNYQIYYFPTDDGIEVYRVLHGRRNVEDLFNEYVQGLRE